MAVSSLESGCYNCVEVGGDGDAPILQCPKTLAQMFGFEESLPDFACRDVAS